MKQRSNLGKNRLNMKNFDLSNLVALEILCSTAEIQYTNGFMKKVLAHTDLLALLRHSTEAQQEENTAY